MEVVMSSPVQECSLMENDEGNGAINLSKSKRKKRQKALKRKLNASLESSEKTDPNTGVGISAGVDKMSMLSPDGMSSSSKGKEHTKGANCEMGSSVTTNVDVEVKVEKKMEAMVGETSSGANATDNTASKRRKRKKMKNNNPDVGDILSTRESSKEGLSMTKVLGVECNETVSGKTATLDAVMGSKEQGHAEAANGKTGESEATDLNVNGKKKRKKWRKSKNKRATFQRLEAANGETGSGTISTDNSASKKETMQKLNKNPDLGDIVSTRESTQEGLSTTKALEVKSGEMVLGKTATPDADMVSKGDHTEVANGKMRESETTDLNVNGKNKMKKKPESKNKQPTLAEILNPQYFQNLEASKGEKGSGTTSADNPASKKQKRQKLNKNSDLGDISSTRESTQEGLRTTKVLEVKGGETVSAEAAAPDANMMSKGDHTEVADGKTGESESTNLNVNGKKKKKRKAKSKNKRPTSGEISDQQYLQNLEAARGEMDSSTTPTGNSASQQRKREKMMNINSDIGNTLSTHESTHEGLSTSKVLEVKSGETVLAKTATLDANIVSNGDHTEVSNGKSGESETTNLNVSGKEKKKRKRKSKNKPPTVGENLNPQYLQNLEAAKTGSGTTSIDNPASKKQKRRRLNRNSDLGDTLSTHESTQQGLSTTKVLEVSGETVSGKTATSDAKTVSKGDHTEVANGKMQENETNNLDVNGKEKKKKKKKPKSKNKGTTLGENLNLPILQNLETAKHEIGSERTVLKSIACPQVANSELGSTSIILKSAEPADPEITETKVNKALAGLGQRMRVKEITQVATLGKKLIILDVNGLLADVVSDRPKDIVADKYITRRAIFKRPYLDDFLCFCFERFKVGIWSSRIMRNLNPVVDFLLGDLKKKLLFQWDACRCTDSGIGTLEVKDKNIVVKDLRKVWDEDGPAMSWVKGTFHESNTLLIDDSPYKALLNPKHTGIFPASYSYKNRDDDNFLGPKGELRIYLEGLAAADDVRMYVEHHPFGQHAIDEQSPHWAFYSSIIERLNNKTIMEREYKKNQWKVRRCCRI